MIPSDWMPHRRPDGETVGYLRMVGDDFQPMDLLGRPLAEASDWLAAEEALDDHSIAWLMDAFLLSLDDGDVRVRVTEVTPERVRVKRDDLGAVGGDARFWELPVPETGRLRPAPPLTEWPGMGGA
ncbi:MULTISPECIES: hypothetical protein [Agrococcus]|uniref:Uncharacterized protein n=1 Tax=Agrococcus pavilionensis RW1 TaxID=1330458 RepID=U1LBH2_9MICO|nr:MULTISPECIES: hypothetical protein [Agrococcus]ERG64463.1 hypothetical protein L332_08370 [Agrococcus pavilionensis RW1]MBO1769976.1 hypothetical protein [Agrococcus sp. TF02-05]